MLFRLAAVLRPSLMAFMVLVAAVCSVRVVLVETSTAAAAVCLVAAAMVQVHRLTDMLAAAGLLAMVHLIVVILLLPDTVAVVVSPRVNLAA